MPACLQRTLDDDGSLKVKSGFGIIVEKCKMTSFSITSLYVDLNEAAKFFDIMILYHSHC